MDPVSEIKERLPIEDVVGRYVDLKRSGSSLKGLCPFHQEKTPSFYVSPSRGSYHCFGCSRGGDVFSFLMEMEHLQFPEALKQLAAQANVSLPERSPEAASLSSRLYAANEMAARFFREALDTPAGARARRYLQDRNFGEEAISLFTLGYAPEHRDAMLRYLRQAGIEDRILLAAGLVHQDEESGAMRDRFRGRLMFPIRDRSGRIVGFGGRTLSDAQPKYLNSPQTEIFDKSSVLFGIHLAQDAIRQARQAVLVEGYLDAVRAHLGGYAYTVASLGTAVTPKQLAALNRFTETVIVALDPDPAGQSAAARASLTALAEVTASRGRLEGAMGALDLRIARLPDGMGDPDELIRDHAALWEQSLRDSVPAFDFFFTRTLEVLDRSRDGWQQTAIDKLVPVIRQFSQSAAWQALWMERLARETGIEPQFLLRSLPAAEAPARRKQRPREQGNNAVVSGTTARSMTSNPVELVEEALLALLLQLVVIPDDAADILPDVHLERGDDRALLAALLDWRENQNYDYEMFRESLPASIRGRADELRKLEAPLPGDGKASIAIALHITRLRQARVQQQLVEVGKMLREVDAAEQMTLVQALGDLNQQKRQIEQALEQLNHLAVSQGTIDHEAGSA